MAQKSVSFIDHPLEPAPRTIFNQKTHVGWWLTYPSEKYEFVTWDDDIPNIWKKNVPYDQPAWVDRTTLW